MTTTTKPRVPAGLSPGSGRIWKQLTAIHQFEEHELVTFTRALQWWDRSDVWLKASEAAEGREKAGLAKQAMDAANSALRNWRTLKFTTDEAIRRPGRPSGDGWNATRRRQAKLREVG